MADLSPPVSPVSNDDGNQTCCFSSEEEVIDNPEVATVADDATVEDSMTTVEVHLNDDGIDDDVARVKAGINFAKGSGLSS